MLQMLKPLDYHLLACDAWRQVEAGLAHLRYLAYISCIAYLMSYIRCLTYLRYLA